MKAARSKPFLELGGVPVIIHTLRKFEQCSAIDHCIVVLPSEQAAEFLSLANKYGLRKISRVVSGGQERQDSVYKGLSAIESNKVEVVAVHDGVRPFVTPDQIAAVVEKAKQSGAAILAVPAVDTIKQVAGGKIIATLERSRIYHAQTPQAFRYPIIREAYERAQAEGVLATDDASLVERLGAPVYIVEGSPNNIKITRPSDLAIAELILKENQLLS